MKISEIISFMLASSEIRFKVRKYYFYDSKLNLLCFTYAIVMLYKSNE